MEVMILPSEGPSTPGRCNCDTLSPKRGRNAVEMERGPADEAVVIVKPDADEPVVTSVRIKHQASDKEVRGEGWNA